MSVWYILGMIAGIIVSVALIALVCVLSRMKFGSKMKFGKCEYDERQTAARGKAYQAGFVTLLIYEALYACLDYIGLEWCENVTGIAIGIFLSVGVFAVVAVSKDAYLSMNENPKAWRLLWLVMALANCTIGAVQGYHMELVRDGKLTANWMNFLCGLLFLVILVAQLIHDHKSKREALDE